MEDFQHANCQTLANTNLDYYLLYFASLIMSYLLILSSSHILDLVMSQPHFQCLGLETIGLGLGFVLAPGILMNLSVQVYNNNCLQSQDPSETA